MATREEIGKEIRLARKGLGYTQKSLSEKTKVNKTTISEIENGRFTGSFDIFERVLDAVRVVTGQHNRAQRVIPIVGDYLAGPVSKQVVRVVLSYTDYINRTVWTKA